MGTSRVRDAAIFVGVTLMALEFWDLAYVVWARVPFQNHLATLVVLLGGGGFLVWWGRRTPSPATPVPEPSPFWTVVAFSTGALLLAYGAAVGWILSLLFSPSRGFLAFLIPWGLSGLGLVAYGGARLAIAPRRAAAAGRARAALSGILPGPPGESEGIVRSEREASARRLRHDVVDLVQEAYAKSAPSIRAYYWTAFSAWLLVLGSILVFLALTPGLGALGFPGPAGQGAGWALLVAAVAASTVEIGVGVPARARALADAGRSIAEGQAPDDWMLLWWVPELFTARLILRFLGRREAPKVVADGGALGTSLSLLSFGRRLVRFARLWHLLRFLVLLVIGPLAAFAGLLVLGHLINPAPSGTTASLAVAWGVALGVLVLDFLLLYRGFRRLDPVSQRLDTLESAEAEVARAFWDRF